MKNKTIVAAFATGIIETVPAVWPAMIDAEIFARAQKVLEAGKKLKTGRESRYPYLLSTRIYCGECGAPLVGISAHGATTKVPYYGHSSQIKREQTLDEKSRLFTNKGVRLIKRYGQL